MELNFSGISVQKPFFFTRSGQNFWLVYLNENGEFEKIGFTKAEQIFPNFFFLQRQNCGEVVYFDEEEFVLKRCLKCKNVHRFGSFVVAVAVGCQQCVWDSVRKLFVSIRGKLVSEVVVPMFWDETNKVLSYPQLKDTGGYDWMKMSFLSFETLVPEIDGDNVFNMAKVATDDGTFILSYSAPRVPRKNHDWYDVQLKLNKI